MTTKEWSVRISIDEDDDQTHAAAVLTGQGGVSVQCTGDARRRPTDAVVPEIGEELAVSRALYALADRLMETAAHDVQDLSHSR